MHELSIAQNVLEIVEHYVPAENRDAVRIIRVMVGELSGVTPDSLAFCFEAITAGTSLGGARLEFEQVPLRARCGTCDTVSKIEENRFRCFACGSVDIEIISGQELKVLEIEVAEKETIL